MGMYGNTTLLFVLYLFLTFSAAEILTFASRFWLGSSHFDTKFCTENYISFELCSYRYHGRFLFVG